MSKRRNPGEIVHRVPGSGFCGSDEPQLIKVPAGKAYEGTCIKNEDDEWVYNPNGESDPCMMGCGDSDCREWANLEVVGGDFDGEFLYHVSECQMVDVCEDSG